MKLLALNIDPGRADHAVDEVVATGTQAVRIVLRKAQPVGAACALYQAAGVRVLGVIASESMAGFDSWAEAAEFYRHLDGVTWTQIGNEPDITSESSWTMTADEYNRLVYIFQRYGPVLGAGLASGQPGWLAGVDTDYLDAIAIHYPTGAWKVAEYAAVYPGDIWVTESHTDPALERELLEHPSIAAVFDWWHNPLVGGGLGIQHHPDRISAFKRLVKEFSMPEFKFGFETYAKEHPEVGKALSGERYFAEDLSCQLAEGGLLVYAKESNAVRFLPGKD